jgi:hypothetical protein
MEAVQPGAPGEAPRADFGAFFAAQHRELGLLAYRLCGERDVAEEIAADAFAEAWRRWDEISESGSEGSDSPAAAMHEIVARLADGRVRRAAAEQPQSPYEPDSTHIWALMNERIALTSPQNTTRLAPGAVGFAVGGQREGGAFGRFRRPGPIGIVIGANAVAAVVAIVVTVATLGSSGPGGHTTVALTETNTAEGASADSASPAAGATYSTPTRSASASASPSPTPDQSTNSASASAAAPTTAPAGVVSPTTATSPSAVSSSASTASADLMTASGSVNVYSSTTWTQIDVDMDIEQTLSALTVTIRVADCTDLSEAGEWNSGASGQIDDTATTNADGSVTYEYVLASGDEATTGDVSFAAQFSHAASGWSGSADTYTVSARSASSGATENLGGSF